MSGCLHDHAAFENIKLDALIASGQREFCFVLLATRFKGATACPARPVAMV